MAATDAFLETISNLSRYLHSVTELIDRAAGLAAESATLVHENERRWRVFREQVDVISRPAIEGRPPLRRPDP